MQSSDDTAYFYMYRNVQFPDGWLTRCIAQRIDGIDTTEYHRSKLYLLAKPRARKTRQIGIAVNQGNVSGDIQFKQLDI